MIDGGADDRQAQRDVDAGKLLPFARRRVGLEAEQLDRDMPLVVKQRQGGIMFALTQDQVGGKRPFDAGPLALPESGRVTCTEPKMQ